MGKLFNPEIITTGQNTTNTLNNNFLAIEEAFDRVLARTGELPNNMEADLDMDGNYILNVAGIDIGGQPLQPCSSTVRWTEVYNSRLLPTSSARLTLYVHSPVTLTIPPSSTLPEGWAIEIVPKRGYAEGITLNTQDPDDTVGGNRVSVDGPCTLLLTPEPGMFEVVGLASDPNEE